LRAFLLIASGGLLLFYREALPQRIAEAINPRPKKRNVPQRHQRDGFSIGGAVEHFEHLLPKSQAEISIVLQRLDARRLSQRVGGKIFYGCKVLVPLVCCAPSALVTNLASLESVFRVCLMRWDWVSGAGLLAGQKIKKPAKKIERGLPDVLDLLVICIEAGLSLDQATARTAEELKKAQPELCDEFGVLVLEQRAGRARSDAWKHLAERTGVDSLRNLVSVLVQSEQFGTSVAKTLRQHADSLRASGFSKWKRWRQRPRSSWFFRWCFSSFRRCSWWFWDRR
jgi:tight adherence protein C